jgi:hypothetical protein
MNIILQHFDGHLRELDVLSVDNIKKYAKMVGAEYQLVRGKPFREHLTAPCQKVHMINEEFDDYDQVLMLDIDMFAPIDMKENVFDLPGIGLYADTQKRLHRDLAGKHPMVASMNTPYWGGAIYKLDKAARKKLRSGLGDNESWMNYYNKAYQFEDEGIMHTLAFKTGYNPKDPHLDRKWCQCSFLPNPEKAGFIHIRTKVTPTGPKREKIENYKDLKSKGILE